MNTHQPTPTKSLFKLYNLSPKPQIKLFKNTKTMTNSNFLFFFFLTITSLLFRTNHAYSRSVSKEELGIKLDDQQTKLTFYFHDVLSGPSPTSVQIAKASGASNSPTTFGALSMIDDLLTEGPESTSKLVGRAQGMYAMADQNEFALVMIMNFLFLEGEFNGSTLSVLGRNPVNEDARELPVVGGTGAFRFAKGYAQVKTQTFDQKSGDSVVEYSVFVSHASGGGSGSGSPGSSSGSGSSGSSSPSHASVSKMVSFGFLMMIPLLYYLCIF